MNTNPDDTRIALWLDDELGGADLAEMDAWAARHPEQLIAREALRNFRSMMSQQIPRSEEPPYPDFFLSRINRGLTARAPEAYPSAKPEKPSRGWKRWLMPIAACAGMAIAFLIGQETRTAPTVAAKEDIPTMIVPAVYTPEQGVQAEWIPAPDQSSSLIVLKGIAAIPDSTDFLETVFLPTDRESNRTAQHHPASSPTSTSTQ